MTHTFEPETETFNTNAPPKTGDEKDTSLCSKPEALENVINESESICNVNKTNHNRATDTTENMKNAEECAITANDYQPQVAETKNTVIEETSFENETSSISEPETVNIATENGSNANDNQPNMAETNKTVIAGTSNGNDISPSSEPKTSNSRRKHKPCK